MDSSPEGCRCNLLGHFQFNKVDEVSITKGRSSSP